MKMRNVTFVIVIGLLLLLLAACGGQEEPTPLPPPQVSQPIATVAVPTPGADVPYGEIIAPDGVYVRTGPSEEYEPIGTIAFGVKTVIVGRSEDGGWWVIPVQGATKNQGWISATYVKAFNTENVPVVPAPPVPAAPPGDATTITGIVWEWQTFTDSTTGTSTRVDYPENYTITFNEDGTLTGKADCNNFAGTYSTDGGFFITLGPSTMAFCGETSLDTQYLQLLGEVAAGGPDGAGGLVLQTAGGAQSMQFSNGGPAQ